LHVHKLDKLPRDIDQYITQNGYPVKPYIMALENNNPDAPERILAYPDQIRWINYGHELYPFEIEDINYIMMNHEGCIGIWMEDDDVVIDDTDGTVEITFINNMYNDDEFEYYTDLVD
jgi:phosphatidate phosphatase PAH1